MPGGVDPAPRQEPLLSVGEADGSPVATPYGVVGLVLSTILILCAATAALIALAVGAFFIGRAMLGSAAVRRIVEDRGTSAGQPLGLIASLLVYAALSGAILAAARIRGGQQWRDLVAWRRWRPFRGARVVWLLVGASILYNIAASAAISSIYPAARNWIVLPHGAGAITLFAILAALAAPFAEELMFRGWIYTSLRRSFGVIAALIVSSILFALAHWESTHLYALVVFPLGLALGYVREQTGSIFASMAFHACYNGFAVALLVAGS